MILKRHVFILEDDSDDRNITEDILTESGLRVRITYFSEYGELVTALRAGQRPSLILMDYNSAQPLPVHEALRKLKLIKSVRDIPVVVLGEVISHHSIAECYANGAASYIIKPSTMELTRHKIKVFFTYWSEVAETGSKISSGIPEYQPAF